MGHRVGWRHDGARQPGDRQAAQDLRRSPRSPRSTKRSRRLAPRSPSGDGGSRTPDGKSSNDSPTASLTTPRTSARSRRSRAATSTPTSSGTYVADWFRYYAGWADKIGGESIVPYPFDGLRLHRAGTGRRRRADRRRANGPLGFCGMGGAPALAAGCCLVIKSPELAPFSPVTFGRLCLEAGIPPGVVNVVTGGPEVGNALVSHPGVDKISFTGGTVTARKLQEACAATLKPMVMELGGKSANIIFADADIDAAITLSSRFTNNAGQGCSMPTRLLVERSVYDRVIDGVVERAGQVVAGDPFDPGVTMGPIISAGVARSHPGTRRPRSRERRRPARDRWPSDRRRPRRRLLHRADDARRRRQPSRDRAERDLRSRAVRDPVRRRGRGGRAGQRHAVRPRRLRAHERHAPGPSADPTTSSRATCTSTAPDRVRCRRRRRSEG